MRFEQRAELLPHLAPEGRVTLLALGEHPLQFQIGGAKRQSRGRHCRVSIGLGIHLCPSGYQFRSEVRAITCSGMNGGRLGLLHAQRCHTAGKCARLEEPHQPKHGEYHTQFQHCYKQKCVDAEHGGD